MTKYLKLKDIDKNKENFFVSYAVRGSIINKECGQRLDMASVNPLYGSIKEPSPLNTRWKYIPNFSCVGIF